MQKKLRFYSDENVSSAVTNGLKLRGLDILTAKGARMLGKSDDEQLAFANKMSRVMISQDSDFLRLHAAGSEHSGIIYAHQKISIGKFIRGVVLVNELLLPEEMNNRLEFI